MDNLERINDYLEFIREYPDAWMTANHYSLDDLKELVTYAEESLKPVINEAIQDYSVLTSDEYEA